MQTFLGRYPLLLVADFSGGLMLLDVTKRQHRCVIYIPGDPVSTARTLSASSGFVDLLCLLRCSTIPRASRPTSSTAWCSTRTTIGSLWATIPVHTFEHAHCCCCSLYFAPQGTFVSTTCPTACCAVSSLCSLPTRENANGTRIGVDLNWLIAVRPGKSTDMEFSERAVLWTAADEKEVRRLMAKPDLVFKAHQVIAHSALPLERPD